MSSGKQVLFDILQEFSQKPVSDSELNSVSERMRVALLLHGSTPEEMWFHVDRIAWITQRSSTSSESVLQGLGIRNTSILLSDILIKILDKAEKDDTYRMEFDELSIAEYKSALHIIRLLMGAMDFCSVLNEVEQDSPEEYQRAVETFMKSYQAKLDFFRKDPGVFLGIDDPQYLEGLKTGKSN